MVNASKEIADEELLIFCNTELNRIMEKHAPERTKTITLRPEQKWMSEDLKNMKRKVRSLERKYKAIKKLGVKQELNILRSKYKKLLCNTKREYINELSECGTNTKKLYQTLNQIIGKDKEVILPPEKDTECAKNSYNSSWIKLKRLMLT